MLKNLIKKLNTGVEKTMKESEGKELEASLAAIESKLKETETQLSTKLEELAAAMAKSEELMAALTKTEEGKAQAEALLKANKTASRKALLSKEIGDEKANKILAATETLSDEAFADVASAMVNASTAEAKTALFKEVGVEGKVEDVSKVAQEESGEMKRLKAKYNPAK